MSLDFPKASRNVDGVVEMMLNATQEFSAELTEERLFGWHAALFPTGRNGMSRIAVGQWRPEESRPHAGRVRPDRTREGSF